jgi:glyoxylase-like metal-dependent hydrolase (beta-lactamase superfamily II)
MLTDDHVLPIALGDNWLYALPPHSGDPEDGLLLVDAGPDYDGSWTALGAQLEAAGYDASNVQIVAITHAHIDHCGLARRWQRANVEVAGGADDADHFAQGDRVVRFQSALVFRFLRECGVPSDRLERFQAARARRSARLRAAAEDADGIAKNNAKNSAKNGATTDAKAGARRERWPGFLRGTPFQPDRPLEDGDTVSAGGRTLSFIAAAGHTPGNGVFYEEASGALFSGDQLLPHITPNPGIHFLGDDYDRRLRSLPTYSRATERIRQLGATHLYPGHGDHTGEVDEVIARTQRHHEQRQRRIRRFLRHGPLTPHALLEKFFPHLPDGRLWQAMAEVVGHIDQLEEDGAVVRESDGEGIVAVRPTG